MNDAPESRDPMLEELIEGKLHPDSPAIVDRMRSDPEFASVVRDWLELDALLSASREQEREDVAEGLAEVTDEDRERAQSLVREHIRPRISSRRNPWLWGGLLVAAAAIVTLLVPPAESPPPRVASPEPDTLLREPDGLAEPCGEVDSVLSLRLVRELPPGSQVRCFIAPGPGQPPMLESGPRSSRTWQLDAEQRGRLPSRFVWWARVEGLAEQLFGPYEVRLRDS